MVGCNSWCFPSYLLSLNLPKTNIASLINVLCHIFRRRYVDHEPCSFVDRSIGRVDVERKCACLSDDCCRLFFSLRKTLFRDFFPLLRHSVLSLKQTPYQLKFTTVDIDIVILINDRGNKFFCCIKYIIYFLY